MLLQLDIDFLPRLNIHNSQRGATLADAFQNLGVSGVIGTV
jgi:hypothetical protein